MRQILECPKSAGVLIAAFLLCARLAAGAQTYGASGLVLKVDRQHDEILVSMQEIPGYMDAMVMPLPVRQQQDLQGLRPGTMVDFRLVVTENSSYAEGIRARSFVSLENDPQGACRLAIIDKTLDAKSTTASRVVPGQHVPDFTLSDQYHRPVSLSQFSGKVVAMTFVYTRCPLPNFCFRLSTNFGQVQRRFSTQMGRDLILLTVTLDPANDQADALLKYGSIWKANNNSWRFLTGSPAAVKRVTDFFGVVSNQDEGTITHSLHTILIDRGGNLVANLEGNEFTGKQLGDLIEVELRRTGMPGAVEKANLASRTTNSLNSGGLQR